MRRGYRVGGRPLLVPFAWGDVMPLLPGLQSMLDEPAARHGIPGAAVAVGLGDDLAEAATGVVNRDTGVETTPETLFQIGSVTKVWTAALVMQLVEDGLVDLDRPVCRYLPGFAVADPEATRSITVRHLLLHVGGFEGDLFVDTGRGDDALDRYLAYLGGHAKQVSAPGERFSYSNAGYAVLGALVAHLRGATWEAVFRERLLEPLGARHTALRAEEAILFRAAAGHGGGRPYGLSAVADAARARTVRRDAVRRTARPRPAGPAVARRRADSRRHPAAVAGVGGCHDLRAGVRVPPRPTPPGGPPRPGPARCQGRYAYPLNTYDVAATGDGLDVTTIPADVLGVSGGPARTVSYVALSGSTFMAARPEAGVHPTITFLDGGRFLFGNGRAAARVG